MVITKVNDLSHTDGEIHKPDISSLFTNLFYYESREKEFTTDIIEERKTFKRPNVLIQRYRFYYHVKIIKKSSNEVQLNIKNDNYVDAQNCTFRKCRNRIVKKLDLLYGEGSVKVIRWKENDEWRKKDYNPDGYFDISIDKRLVWGGDLKFNKLTYWDVITDINKFYRANIKSSYVSLLNDEDITDFNYDVQIFFISDSISSNHIFEAIDQVNPDVVIFTGSDDFIENKVVFNGEKGRNFINFLNNTQKTLLLFSVKPDSRHFYKIGDEESFLDKYDITAHTWDSNAVIEKILDNGNSNFNTNICSPFGEIKYWDKLNAEYIPIVCLDTIEESIPKILQIMDNNNKVNRFFIDLIKSPLYIYSDNPKINFRRGDWNFENILGYIMEIDIEILNEVIKTFKSCYVKDNNPHNPIMNKIFQLLTDILNKDNSIALIIVNYYDKRGTEQIILDNGFHDYIPERIRIYTWNELATIDLESEPDNEFYVISTIRPYISYELYNSYIKNFIFIGSNQNLEEIETIMDNRLNEKNARPLYIPSSDMDSPELLRNILHELPNAEKINDIVADLEFEEKIVLSGEKRSIEPIKEPKTHQMKIHEGEEVILAVDGEGNGLFLPLERIISFKNDNNNSIEDIKVLKSKLSNLRGREIIIDNHGFYASYKAIFTKFVVEIGENTLVKTPFYNWKGFKELIYNASEWMRLLRKTLIRIQEDKKISENEAKDKLSSILVDLDIHASHHSYIKNFWLAEPSIISTSSGMIQIFEIEHPRGLNDLIEIYEKINELLPEIELGTDNAGRCYTAAITLQNIRRNFLRGQNIRPEYTYLYEKLHEKIKMIVRYSVKFKVESITTVKLRKEAYPFRILQNYQEYY